jgi:DNA-binding IclR family transcriptional regulator
MHWSRNRFKNPIGITRDMIMLESKIASVATYHKTIQELQKLGYIRYEPSFNPHIGTAVFMLPFKALNKKEVLNVKIVQKDQITCSKNEQLKLSTCSKNEQVSIKKTIKKKSNHAPKI